MYTLKLRVLRGKIPFLRELRASAVIYQELHHQDPKLKKFAF